MAQIGRPGLSATKKAELWARFKAGESFTAIGRALGKPAGSIYWRRPWARWDCTAGPSPGGWCVDQRRARSHLAGAFGGGVRARVEPIAGTSAVDDQSRDCSECWPSPVPCPERMPVRGIKRSGPSSVVWRPSLHSEWWSPQAPRQLVAGADRRLAREHVSG